MFVRRPDRPRRTDATPDPPRMEELRSYLPAALAFAVFAAAHSALASARVKRAVLQLAPGIDRGYRLAYNVLAGILLGAAWWALPADRLLVTVPPPASWALHAVRLAGMALLAASVRHVDGLAFLGIRQLSVKPGYLDEPERGRLIRKGAHAWIRHPIYTGLFLVLIGTPTVGVRDLVVLVLAVVYMAVGARHEERGLVARFGEDYEDYRREVGAFWPRGRT